MRHENAQPAPERVRIMRNRKCHFFSLVLTLLMLAMLGQRGDRFVWRSLSHRPRSRSTRSQLFFFLPGRRVSLDARIIGLRLRDQDYYWVRALGCRPQKSELSGPGFLLAWGTVRITFARAMGCGCGF